MLDQAQIDRVLQQHFAGLRATASKRGRNPKWPYVPIIIHGDDRRSNFHGRSEQIRAKAFETRDEAIDYASRVIAARKADLEQKIKTPRFRALRRQNGLPEEISA